MASSNPNNTDSHSHPRPIRHKQSKKIQQPSSLKSRPLKPTTAFASGKYTKPKTRNKKPNYAYSQSLFDSKPNVKNIKKSKGTGFEHLGHIQFKKKKIIKKQRLSSQQSQYQYDDETMSFDDMGQNVDGNNDYNQDCKLQYHQLPVDESLKNLPLKCIEDGEDMRPYSYEGDMVMMYSPDAVYTEDVVRDLGFNDYASDQFYDYHDILLKHRNSIIQRSEKPDVIILPTMKHRQINRLRWVHVNMANYKCDGSGCTSNPTQCDHSIIARMLVNGNRTGLTKCVKYSKTLSFVISSITFTVPPIIFFFSSIMMKTHEES